MKLSNPKTRRFLRVTFAILVVATIVAGNAPEGRLRSGYFALGVKHRVEDKRSGIVYAEGAEGCKLYRNGDYTPQEWRSVQYLMSLPTNQAESYFSTFMAGYRFGVIVPEIYWVAVGLAALMAIVFLARRIVRALRL